MAILVMDVHVDSQRASLEVPELGYGQFQMIADALLANRYDRIVSFESVFHTGDSDIYAGFRRCIAKFKTYFSRIPIG